MQSRSISFFNSIFFLSLCVIIAALFSSCHKTGLQTDRPHAQISFYNASEYLQAQLVSPSKSAELLIDTPDTAVQPDGSTQVIPFFSSANYTTWQFPNMEFNAGLPQPWISYMQVPAGDHIIILTDTSAAQRPLAFNRISAVQNLPMTIYYTDSLGKFSTWPLIDTTQPSNDFAGIRVLDFSPDAGNVFFTINGQAAAGFPDTLHFGTVTSFVPWSNPSADTLQLRFYNTGDSVDVVAAAFLYASPGHAYNLLLRGYQNNQSYPDPATGQMITFNSDLKAIITQNK